VKIDAPTGPGFSFADYSAALRGFLIDGYAVTSFTEYLASPTDRHVILRHDIDNSIDQAIRIARLDAEAGCSSTIFLRVHARGYNILSLPSMQLIREFEDLGHEVGLHLEGGLYELIGGDQVGWADRQRTALEFALGHPIRGFSMHEPARLGGTDFAEAMLERWAPDVDYHSYEDRFTTPNMKYLSDSSGRWREGHFGEWIGREPLFQVLTHPFWWFDRNPAENY